MQIPVQIVLRNIHSSEALDMRIKEKAAKLEKFASRIMSCRVTVEQLGMHQSHGRQFSVRIDLRVPGRAIEITREHDQDFHVALRDAFQAAARQLGDMYNKQTIFKPGHASPGMAGAYSIDAPLEED